MGNYYNNMQQVFPKGIPSEKLCPLPTSFKLTLKTAFIILKPLND